MGHTIKPSQLNRKEKSMILTKTQYALVARFLPMILEMPAKQLGELVQNALRHLFKKEVD